MRIPVAVRRSTGFTLVEVMVALFIMGLLAVMSWKGVDAIVRSRDISAAQLERQLRLQSVMSQWETDLSEVQDTAIVPALQFDGASLRLTRRSPDGMQLVVWSRRGEGWTRWAAPPVTHSQELQQWWMRSQQLLGNEPGQLRTLGGIASWQVYFWRNNGWSNAQSSGDAKQTTSAGGTGTPTDTRVALPTGVRLVLAFADGSGYSGGILRDVQLGPQMP